MTELKNDGLPPWPEMPSEFDPAAIVSRRTSPLAVGSIVFVKTDKRVYRRRWNGKYHESYGAPVARYTYQPRRIDDETKISWLLASVDRQQILTKVPKRDLSKIYGAEDVEDALWVAEHRGSISRAVADQGVTREQLEAIRRILIGGDPAP